MNKKVIVSCLAFLMVLPSVLLGGLQSASAANLAYDLRGRILLQVEDNGEAWYVNPENLHRYYMGRPDDAFQLMRELGLGISDSDLSKIKIGQLEGEVLPSNAHENAWADTSLTRRLSGKILLQVEENGEAWYVNPVDLKRYYLGRPADAFRIMRFLGLGITNNDLQAITVEAGYANYGQNNNEQQNSISAFDFNSLLGLDEDSPEVNPFLPEDEIEVLLRKYATKDGIDYVGLTEAGSNVTLYINKTAYTGEEDYAYFYEIYAMIINVMMEDLAEEIGFDANTTIDLYLDVENEIISLIFSDYNSVMNFTETNGQDWFLLEERLENDYDFTSEDFDQIIYNMAAGIMAGEQMSTDFIIEITNDIAGRNTENAYDGLELFYY